MPHERSGWLSEWGLGTAKVGLEPRVRELRSATGSPRQLLHGATVEDAATPRGLTQQWDWGDELTGKHRTVFDTAAHKSDKPLA